MSARRIKNGDLTFWRNRRRALLEKIVRLHNTGAEVPGCTLDAFVGVGSMVRRLEASAG